MKVLVTGGAGYIGSIVAADLLRAGHTVTIFDSLIHGYRAAIPQEARFVQGDLLDEKALQQVLAEDNFEAVLHFAAFIEAGESMRQPGEYFGNNVTGSLNLIEAVVRHNVPRFVFSSTAGIYAGKDTPLTEDDPTGPANVYGQTKLMIEQILSWYHRLYGLRYAALRYFNAAGALPSGERGEAHEPETHLIPNILRVPLGQQEKFTLFGNDYPTPDGTCIRDYIHILDLSSAHLLALEALDKREKMIYNLGNGAGYSNLQVLETARRVTGHPIPTEFTPRRPGDAPALVADSSRIRQELGWTPQYPDLETIISHAWQWHKTHPQGYKT
ncbi:MAG: UDP-glucose 4-epimerase GalE [Anaerolineae bacterium]|nr:UDP-glucose 4-epimerase GalE [Anaerolineae bacterium]